MITTQNKPETGGDKTMIELARELGLALANSCEFVQMKHRITSYNVCYTKLLRIIPTSESDMGVIDDPTEESEEESEE